MPDVTLALSYTCAQAFGECDGPVSFLGGYDYRRVPHRRPMLVRNGKPAKRELQKRRRELQCKPFTARACSCSSGSPLRRRDAEWSLMSMDDYTDGTLLKMFEGCVLLDGTFLDSDSDDIGASSGVPSEELNLDGVAAATKRMDSKSVEVGVRDVDNLPEWRLSLPVYWTTQGPTILLVKLHSCGLLLSSCQNAWYRYVLGENSMIGREDANKEASLSIRCIKDIE